MAGHPGFAIFQACTGNLSMLASLHRLYVYTCSDAMLMLRSFLPPQAMLCTALAMVCSAIFNGIALQVIAIQPPSSD